MTVRVKICGLTRPADAEWAARCGADAIGFVFAKSPRSVSLARAREIARAAGPWVARVGVFVNATRDQILRTAEALALSAVQLHGDEDAAFAARVERRVPVLKAFGVGLGFDLARPLRYNVSALLFDAQDIRRGGTGRRFDWSALPALPATRRVVISGGLTPVNVAEAIRRFRPYGVDVSSGVERSAGLKDPELVRKFIRNAKREDV